MFEALATFNMKIYPIVALLTQPKEELAAELKTELKSSFTQL